MLKVNVVICHAVNNQQWPLELRSVRENAALLISCCISRGKAKVTFGVVGIVILPIGDRGTDNATTEDLGAANGRHSREVSAERPAYHPNSRQIHFRKSFTKCL